MAYKSAYRVLFSSSSTCKPSNGPGIYDNIADLEAQFVYCKLDHYIHGVGLILGERHSLAERSK